MSLTNFPHGVTSFGMPIYGYAGCGPGRVYHLIASAAASNLYYKMLTVDYDIDNSLIFDTLAEAEDAMVGDQGDTLLVYPGDHAVTSEITWDKNDTKIIGVGSVNQLFQPSTLTSGGIRLKCTTAAVASILNVTGNYFSVYNCGTFNSAASTSNLCDVKVAGKNFYAENCSFRGGNSTTQTQNATAGIPIYIKSDVAGGGNAAYFKNCNLGSPGNAARTTGAGAMHCLGGASAGFAITLDDCVLAMRCETNGSSNPALIKLAGNYAIDRYLRLTGKTLLYNFWENMGGNPDYAIVDGCATTHTIIIGQNVEMIGFDAICNVATYCFTTAANAASDGSKGIAVDTTP